MGGKNKSTQNPSGETLWELRSSSGKLKDNIKMAPKYASVDSNNLIEDYKFKRVILFKRCWNFRFQQPNRTMTFTANISGRENSSVSTQFQGTVRECLELEATEQGRFAWQHAMSCAELTARVIPQTSGRSTQEPRTETTGTDQVPLFREVQHELGRGRMGEMRSGSHILNLTTKWMRASHFGSCVLE